MSTAEIRTKVHDIIDQVDDSFLNVVYSMLGAYVSQNEGSVIGYDQNGDPVYANVAKKEYTKRISRMAQGDVTTIGGLKNEVAEW